MYGFQFIIFWEGSFLGVYLFFFFALLTYWKFTDIICVYIYRYIYLLYFSPTNERMNEWMNTYTQTDTNTLRSECSQLRSNVKTRNGVSILQIRYSINGKEDFLFGFLFFIFKIILNETIFGSEERKLHFLCESLVIWKHLLISVENIYELHEEPVLIA